MSKQTTKPRDDWQGVMQHWLRRPPVVALVLEVDRQTQRVISWRTERLEDVAAFVEGLEETIPNPLED